MLKEDEFCVVNSPGAIALVVPLDCRRQKGFDNFFAVMSFFYDK